ncbi:uncharacterized protein DS421_15g496430 [Arachis hypogaea]|nr:uncharacterized protein DS421_15g496430 [Arachis hypogaea]
MTLMDPFFIHLRCTHLSRAWRLKVFPKGFTIRESFQGLHQSSYSSKETSIVDLGLKGTWSSVERSTSKSSGAYSSETISTISCGFSFSKPFSTTISRSSSSGERSSVSVREVSVLILFFFFCLSQIDIEYIV